MSATGNVTARPSPSRRIRSDRQRLCAVTPRCERPCGKSRARSNFSREVRYANRDRSDWVSSLSTHTAECQLVRRLHPDHQWQPGNCAMTDAPRVTCSGVLGIGDMPNPCSVPSVGTCTDQIGTSTSTLHSSVTSPTRHCMIASQPACSKNWNICIRRELQRMVDVGRGVHLMGGCGKLWTPQWAAERVARRR